MPDKHVATDKLQSGLPVTVCRTNILLLTNRIVSFSVPDKHVANDKLLTGLSVSVCRTNMLLLTNYKQDCQFQCAGQTCFYLQITNRIVSFSVPDKHVSTYKLQTGLSVSVCRTNMLLLTNQKQDCQFQCAGQTSCH